MKSILALLLIILGSLIFQTQSWTQTKNMECLEGILMGIVCGNCRYGSQDCKANLKTLAGLKESGHYDFAKEPISQNAYGIKSMTFQSVLTQGYFEFPNKQQNGLRNLSGLLALPNHQDGKENKIRGIVIYFHQTIFSKKEAPSIQENIFYKAFAAIFGANNYAVLFPDYPGHGADAHHVHPYALYPEPNVRSAIYLLNHVVDTLNAKYNNRISKNNQLPVFSYGYSEGGAYAVFFGACNTPTLVHKYKYCVKDLKLDAAYRIAAITGSEGVYDPDGVVNDYWFQQVKVAPHSNRFKAVSQRAVNKIKPPLASLSIISYAAYNPDPFIFGASIQSEFFDMKCTFGDSQTPCNIGDIQMNLEQILYLDSQKSGTIKNKILYGALNKSNNDYNYVKSQIDLIHSKNNSLYSLVNKTPLNLENFHAAMKEANILYYGNHAPYPVFLFTLERDSYVVPLNTEKFVENNESGNVYSYTLQNELIISCEEGQRYEADHPEGYFFSHFFVLEFIEKVMRKQVVAKPIHKHYAQNEL